MTARFRLLAASLVAGALFLLHLIRESIPYPPTSVAQWIIHVTPGGVATKAIDVFGHWAMRLLSGLVTAAFIAGLAWTLGFIHRSPAPPADPVRRRLLRALAFGAAGLVTGSAAVVRSLPRATSRLGGRLVSLGPVRRATPPPRTAADDAVDATPRLTIEPTPNPSFYIVDESIDDPDIDASTWRLRIRGAIGSPLTLTYEDLISLPAVEEYLTLECISNRVAGNLISTALWRGVRLADLLQRSPVDPRVTKVITRAVGGYETDLTIATALDKRTLVAYGMNGRTLPRPHGFPARIIAPGLYGMKNCKWLDEIEVTTRNAQGYWEQRGWSDEAVVRTMSRIDAPPDNSTVEPGTTIGGIAFAGDRGISRVEVTIDGGKTWAPANVARALGQSTWRRWIHAIPHDARGALDVMVRAVDGAGAYQEAEFRSPHPSGATGIHRITLTVR